MADVTRAPLAALPLRRSEDVVAARLHALRVAELLGFDRQAQTRIATAVSEIARNAFVHARDGEITFAVEPAECPQTFDVVVRDAGPGIDGLDAVLAGARSFPAGRGSGLTSARRLVDGFAIRSSPQGTEVRLSQRLPRAAASRLTPTVLSAVQKAVVPQRADPLAIVHQQNRELIDSLTEIAEREAEASRLNRELEETNRGVVALYSELDERAEQLRTASELKSRFLSHMSHEFRTPLNSILALSRLLLDRIDGELNAEQARQVDYIRRSAQGLLEMVNDLLDLAKVEAGKVDVRPAPFRVSALFAALRGSLRPLLVNPAVELVFEDAPDLPELVSEETKVAQILRNFVSNALKFTERGEVRISARLDAGGTHVTFAVADTGIGIPPASLAHLFEDFAQVDGPLQRGGTGLGLSLSRRLATLLGGEVGAESEPGRGSIFRLTLPLHIGQAHEHGEGDGPQPRTVMVVDDEEAFRYVVRHIAQDTGHQVIEVADCEQALARIREQPPDVVVVDMDAAPAGGAALLEQIGGGGARAVPVIVCTTRPPGLEQKRALAAAYAIVPKHDISRSAFAALLDGALHQTREVP